MAAASLFRRHDRPSPQFVSKREALEHLASIDLNELSNEAKIERCRATRDLRSCGRIVHHVLESCGHASLCAECGQRCDLCPICRIPIPKDNASPRLRLYYECIEAGLIPKKYDDKFQEEDGEKELDADVQRLHFLFDVSMENNLVSLICHYVTDVCMDKSAVSSDPVIAFLLDEVVVKDWCKRTFGKIITDLRGIYSLEEGEMQKRLSSLQRYSLQLTGISNVLEVLESSIKGTLSAPYDLHCLQENVLKAKQHLEIMIWCIRHQFLQNIKLRHHNHMSWRSLFCERKSAAIKRAWPDLIISNSSTSCQHNGSTLFIEDALSNLEVEQGYGQEIGKDIEITTLAKDGGSSSFFKSKIDGVMGCYPFETLRDATDILFLCGSSDMVVAKQAIFLYYLYDRHWTMPDEKWRYLLDDFAASFSITRHSVLESFTFYLLDDHTDQALQEACKLLPEIAAPERHPKIAQVLLERQNPDAALMFLRWCGYDGLYGDANTEHSRTQSISLPVAVTAVRVRVECGLLTEAFMYQRSLCVKVKEEKSKRASSRVFSNNLKGEHGTWLDWMEALVTELCYLCIRRNLVDRMIELPWNFDEEKYLHKCLLDCATGDPSSTTGSLLAVFYLQRCRYIEAYQVDLRLKNLEHEFISKSSTSDRVISRIRSTSQWRTGLVGKCIELLPKVQQDQVKSGNFDIGFTPAKEVECLSKSDTTQFQIPNSASLLAPVLPIPSKSTSAFETQPKVSIRVANAQSEVGSYHSPSILNKRFLTPVRGAYTPEKDNSVSKQLGITESFKVDGSPTHGISLVNPQNSLTLKEVNKSSWKLRNDQLDKVPSGSKPFIGVDHGLVYDSVHDLNPTISGSQMPSFRPWTEASTNTSMDISWSHGNGDSTGKDTRINEARRWRSDETSDDENDPTPEMIIGGASLVTPKGGSRRRRPIV